MRAWQKSDTNSSAFRLSRWARESLGYLGGDGPVSQYERTQLYNDFLEWPFNVVSSQEKFKLKRAAHSHVDAVGCALHLIREVLFKACQSTNAHSISISLGKSFHMSSLWKILYNLEIALCRKVKFFPPLETKSLMGNFEKY